MGPYLKLARPLNCVMSAVAVFLGAFMGLGFSIINREYLLPVLLAMVAVVFFVAAGNALNDYEDRFVDKKAHPERPIPSGKLKASSVRGFAWACFTVSVGIALFIDLRLPMAFALLLFNLVMMVSYERSLKRIGIPGNLAISWLTASLFLFGAVSVGKIGTVIVLFTAMAFLSIFMREIAKDIEDMDGDRGARLTAPMRHGIRPSSALASLSVAAAIMLSPLPWMMGQMPLPYMVIVLVADAIFIYCIALLMDGRAGASQNTAKLGMLVSLIAFAAGVVA